MRAQRGFTMIELLVTLAISTFGLLGVLALHKSLARGVSTNDQYQEAVAFGARTLETLRAMRVDQMTASISTTATVPPMAQSGYATLSGRNGITYTADVAVTEVAGTGGLWRLRVEVSWSDDGEIRMLPLELLRTTREAL